MDNLDIYSDRQKVRITVTWDAPLAKGTMIKAYGVTRCFTTTEETSCLVPGTPLPDGSLVFIQEASASAGKISWTWPAWDAIGRPIMADPRGHLYEALVIAAYNESGHSKFAIVASSTYCEMCTY